MTSSTSSSDRAWIWGAAGFFLLLLVGFFLAVREAHPPVFTGSQLKDNRAHFQDYLARDGAPALVVAGSSYSGVMEPYFDRSRVASLAQGGFASPTGVAFLARTGALPGTLLVEISQRQLASIDEAGIEDAVAPWNRFLRRRLPFLQYHRQPLSLLMAALSKRKQGVAGPMPTACPAPQATNLDGEARQSYAASFAALGRALSGFSNQVEVVFFSLPQAGPHEAERRALVRLAQESFPKKSWRWIPDFPDLAWETSDETHLTKSSAWHAWRFIQTNL